MRYSPWYYWYPWTNIKFLQTNDSINRIIIQSPPQIPNCLAYDTLLSEERNQLLSARIKQETLLLPTNRVTYLCKCNGVADLKEYQEANHSCPPYMYYCAEFGHFTLKCVGINTRELPKLGSAETPLETWGVADPNIHTPPREPMGVCMNRKEPQKLGSTWGPPPLGVAWVTI